MAITHYKIWAWGEDVEAGGVFPTKHIGVHGIAKPAIPGHPLAIANELICAELGHALRLPIPPSFVVQREERGAEPVPHFVSLKFLFAGENLPPADCDAIVAKHPDLAAGIVVFDNWICNNDRHDENLAYDEDSDRVHLFDHSHALMTGMAGRARLEGLRDGLRMNGCCLPRLLKDISHFDKWTGRILQLPAYYVRDTIGAAADTGLSADEVGFLADFLLDRRERLPALLKAARSEFVSAPATLSDAQPQG